jgi:hypothetical protein
MRSMVEGAATLTEFRAAPSTAYGGPPPPCCAQVRTQTESEEHYP